MPKITKSKMMQSAKILLSLLFMFAISLTTISANSVSTKPLQPTELSGKAEKPLSKCSIELCIANFDLQIPNGDDDKKKLPPTDDGRKITESKIEIVEEKNCDCAEDEIKAAGFPGYALLGLAPLSALFFAFAQQNDVVPPIDPNPVSAMRLP